MLDKLTNIILGGLYNFKSNKQKLKLLSSIEDNNLTIDEQTRLIKSLSKQFKLQELKKIFNFYREYNMSWEKNIELFNKLSYKEKIYVLKNIIDSYNKKELINTLSKYEYIKVLNRIDLSNEDRKYIIEQLDSKTRKFVYKMCPAVIANDKVEIMKYFSEQTIDKVLRKGYVGITILEQSQKARLLEFLPNDQDKLDCLDYPNKYKLQLSYYQIRNVLLTLSDKEKLNFIEKEKYYNIDIHNLDKENIIISLSDKEKIKYLNDAQKFENISLWKYGSFLRLFFESFSKEYSRMILKQIDNFDYKLSSDNIVTLINNLNINERIEFLKSSNVYDISLNNENKCKIIFDLPIQYKLEILKNSDLYRLSLDENNIKDIIKKMNISNVVNLIILDKKNNINLSDESLWNIIENLERADAINLLTSKNESVKEFVQKYKTSFVKCLSNEEKLEVVCNKSKYNIYLEDERKIKILKSIKKYSSLEYFDNIINYFDNPKILVDYFFTNKKYFDNLHELFQKSIVSFHMNIDYNDDDVEFGLSILQNMSSGLQILTKYKTLKELFGKISINFYDFIQYGMNSNKYNWYENISNILDNNKLDEFMIVKNYFFNNYYNIKNDSKFTINNFLEILEAFNRFELLCINVANENKNLTGEDKEDIRFLFKSNTLEGNLASIEEISNFRKETIKSYANDSKCSVDIYKLKDILFKLLFDKSFQEMKDILSYTGRTTDLEIIKFNNRNNTEIVLTIDKLILVTFFAELIIDTTDVNGIKQVLSFYTDNTNIEQTKKIFNFCSKYEEYNRKIYECDFKASLTNIDMLDQRFSCTEKAIEMSNKYGGRVVDLSESQYVLGAHVKSGSETIEDLMSGNSDGKSNFICLSPVSHRGQHYYYGYSDYKTIFAYDDIEDDSFICSSINNMGSNMVLKYNSAEVPTISRIQKGILETSEASTGNNAEILLYRSSLKPCGIIVPTGHKPSDEAIECHKKFDLPFIITQEIDKKIENPLKVPSNSSKLNFNEIDNVELVKEIVDNFIKYTQSKERKIAILTDSHALYEPTLSCLIDIKKRGIKEIYSLGDNIGHGPNPKEVLKLLDDYGVKSVYGNHEIYINDSEGIKEMKDHFPSEESIERTKEMVKWTKIQLTKEQLDSMKIYPKKYEINIPNGKKLVLIHTDKPYSSSGKYSSVESFDKESFVIKGHDHFESESENSITLRGVGIGQNNGNVGNASYCIINVLDDDYRIEKIYIPYDRSNLLHTINESDMPVFAKSLIRGWVAKN